MSADENLSNVASTSATRNHAAQTMPLARGAGMSPRSGGVPVRAPGLSMAHISVALDQRQALIEFYRGASFLKVKVEHDPGNPGGKKRNEITTFSNASRRRFLDLMAKLDNSLVPIFVTLTYPDHFPAYREEFKNHLDLLGQRIRRRWRGSFILWKLEFKERQSGENKGRLAPHYHLFVYGVPMTFAFRQELGESYSVRLYLLETKLVWEQRVLGEFVEATTSEAGKPAQDDLKRWMSRNWFEIVGSGDMRHFQAGTKVEELRSVKGAFYYASKLYMGKEPDWGPTDTRPGRFWGVIGRANLRLGQREIRELKAKQAFTLLRTMRRYRRANTAPKKRQRLRTARFSAKIYCNVEFWVHRLTGLVGPLPEPSPFRASAETWIGRKLPARTKPLRIEQRETSSNHAVAPSEASGRAAAAHQFGFLG